MPYLSTKSLFFPLVSAPLLVSQALSSATVILSGVFDSDGLLAGGIFMAANSLLYTLMLVAFPYDSTLCFPGVRTLFNALPL